VQVKIQAVKPPPTHGTNHKLNESTRFVCANAIVRIPKELARINSGLLVSRWYEVIAMLKSKTHFEQVPLEAVRKIVEEQSAREITIEHESVSGKKKLEKDFLAVQVQSTASSRTNFR
jgi:hypothetical protein